MGERKRVTPREAADELGVSPQLVYRLFHSGELLGVKVAGAVRIDRDSLAAYIEAHRNRRPEAEPAPPLAVATDPRPTPSRRRGRGGRPAKGFQFFPPT